MRGAIDTAYCTIYQVLDDLRPAEILPVGAMGRMFSALDRLRASEAPGADIAIAESISVAMHRWDLARRKNDGDAEKTVREQLAELTQHWLDTSVPTPDTLVLQTDAILELDDDLG
tara:strand:- start:621 stop:968 length:348 start_codon:yes stop_codon:yes gene_type:complete